MADMAVGAKRGNHKGPATKLVNEWRMFSTWRTRDEVVAVAKRLGSLDAGVHSAFVTKIVEFDPSLQDVLAAPRN